MSFPTLLFFLVYIFKKKKKRLTSFTLLSFPKSNQLIAYGTDGECFCPLMSGVASLLHFTYWSQACPVVWCGEGGGRVGVQSLLRKINTYAVGTPIPIYIPELNPCILVAMMMSVSVITEMACAHTHTVSPRQIVSSLFIVPAGPLVVEETLPFCTSKALVSSKHLCFVCRGTCEKEQINLI